MIESRQSYSKESRVQFFWPTLYAYANLADSIKLSPGDWHLYFYMVTENVGLLDSQHASKEMIESLPHWRVATKRRCRLFVASTSCRQCGRAITDVKVFTHCGKILL